MRSRDFAYWLMGFFEVGKPTVINEEETQLIKQHLNLVFKHEIDPSMGNENHQIELNKIHSGEPEFMSLEWAIQHYGSKPSDKHEFNMHGWYDPSEGIPRC